MDTETILLIAIPAYLIYVLVGYFLAKLIFKIDPPAYEKEMKSGWGFWLLVLTIWPIPHTMALFNYFTLYRE